MRAWHGFQVARMSATAHYPSLFGKVVLITGGGSGIGESFTEHFWQQHCKVAFFDIDDDASARLVARLAHTSGAPYYRRCDITDIDAIQASVADVEDKLGPIQVLVN